MSSTPSQPKVVRHVVIALWAFCTIVIVNNFLSIFYIRGLMSHPRQEFFHPKMVIGDIGITFCFTYGATYFISQKKSWVRFFVGFLACYGIVQLSLSCLLTHRFFLMETFPNDTVSVGILSYAAALLFTQSGRRWFEDSAQAGGLQTKTGTRQTILCICFAIVALICVPPIIKHFFASDTNNPVAIYSPYGIRFPEQ